MFDRFYIKHEDFVFMRKVSHAKKPKYDINKSVLMRDVKALDRWETDTELTEAGVQDIVQKIQLAMSRRFKSVIPAAEIKHYRFNDAEKYLILENTQLMVTVQDSDDRLTFEIKEKQMLNTQSIKFMQSWCETVSRTLIANRKPIYSKLDEKIDSKKELNEILLHTRPKIMKRKEPAF